MKYIKYLLLIILAGTCTGLFFYVRVLHTLRSLAPTEADSSLLWAFAPLSTLGQYVLTANLGLLVFWLLYSLVVSRLSGTRLYDTLRIDAYTYLPLCLLSLPLSQFNAFLTHYFEGFLLLSTSFGNLLLIGALMGVFALKVKSFPTSYRPGAGKVPALPGKAPTWRFKLLIFLISLVLYVLVGMRTTTLEPGGDEPHYLLITYSLLHDHDLAINNNYDQKDYKSFHSGDLDKHIAIGKDGTRYSIHPIGLPILLLPSFAFKGRQGTVVFMNILAALLALQLYLLSFAITQQKRIALLLWFVASFTTPLLFYSSHIYPEMPLALLLITAYRIIIAKNAAKLSTAILLGCGLAGIPWLHSRMALPACLLLLYHLLNIWISSRKTHWTPRRIRFAVIPLCLLALSGLLLAGYYYRLFGSPLPMAAYASAGRTDVFSLSIFLKKGLLGFFLDQEAGLLTFAPYYLFLFPGFVLLMRRQLSQAVWLFILIASIYVPCGGFTDQWHGGWSPAARYIVDLIPLFWAPFCLCVQHASQRRFFRYIFAFLVIIGFYWSYLFLENPLSSIMREVGRNPVFEYYSSVVDVTRYFPSFIVLSPSTYVLAGLWLIGIIGFSIAVVHTSSFAPTPPRTEQMDAQTRRRLYIVKHLKNVLVSYGAIVMMFLLYTTIAEHTKGHPEGLRLNRNRELHEFLANVEYDTAVKNQILRQQPIAAEDVQFTYLHRAKEGKVTKDGPRTIVSGPRESFPKGKYIAYFTMMVTDNTVSDAVLTIDVVARRGKLIFNQKTLRGSDFAAAGKYERFPLPFELNQDVTNLETRVHFHNRVDISVEKIVIAPDLSRFYASVGLSKLRQGQTAAAHTMFLRALAVADHPQAAYYLGVLEQGMGNWEYAGELLQQVVAREPNFADAHYRLGLALKQTGQLAKARQVLEQATQLLPNHLDAWKALQDTYQQLNLAEQFEIVEPKIQKLYHPQYPYSVEIGNQIMFLGYSVQNPAPGKLHLEYYWKALLPMDRDYVFFVHFNGTGAKFQQDHDPHQTDLATGHNVFYPTSKWQIGEVIKEIFDIPAPAGTFDIEIGVWDHKQRLSISDAKPIFPFWKSQKLSLHPVTIQ
jgi:tetratricopeptide (TPR) repeat protein